MTDNNKLRLLITGVSGMLGNNLAYYFKDKFEVLGLYLSHPVSIKGVDTTECDLTQKEKSKKLIKAFGPVIIVHCAALTNVDQCEADKSLTKLINVTTTQNLVESISNTKVKLVHISTDSVYDGIKGKFSEDDRVNPVNYYGLTKYEAELEAMKKQNSLILRTNIFGWNIQDKKSLGEWILSELQAKRSIKGFKDAYFSTIYTLELAKVIERGLQNNLSGIYNCGSAHPCSKYEFALILAECFGLDKSLISPISIDDVSFVAKRVKCLSMDVSKIQRDLNYHLPSVAQSIEAFNQDYIHGLPYELKKKKVLS